MKKIMFTDDLTRAVLEERKTMTRRIMAVQKDDLCSRLQTDEKGRLYWRLAGDAGFPEGGKYFRPPFEANTIVALAQRYSDIVVEDPGMEEMLINKLHLEDAPGWSNKMYVASELMPHQIRMNSWRVERMQHITDEDCIKEGIWNEDPFGWTYDGGFHFDTPREAFAALIDKISGKGTWDKNPWVWAYNFQLVR